MTFAIISVNSETLLNPILRPCHKDTKSPFIFDCCTAKHFTSSQPQTSETFQPTH